MIFTATPETSETTTSPTAPYPNQSTNTLQANAIRDDAIEILFKKMNFCFAETKQLNTVVKKPNDVEQVSIIIITRAFSISVAVSPFSKTSCGLNATTNPKASAKAAIIENTIKNRELKLLILSGLFSALYFEKNLTYELVKPRSSKPSKAMVELTVP